MRPSRILESGCLCCALVLVLGFTGGTAQATMIEGSSIVSAFMVSQNGADLASSTLFTPIGPTGGGSLYMYGGVDDFALLPAPPALIPCTAPTLDITDGTSWEFTCTGEGKWETTEFTIVTSTTNYLDLLLTGTFTPDPSGLLKDSFGAPLDPTPGTLRISLNQSGPIVGWTGTMTMVPEPMTMSLLAVGGLALLRRRRRK